MHLTVSTMHFIIRNNAHAGIASSTHTCVTSFLRNQSVRAVTGPSQQLVLLNSLPEMNPKKSFLTNKRSACGTRITLCELSLIRIFRYVRIWSPRRYENDWNPGPAITNEIRALAFIIEAQVQISVVCQCMIEVACIQPKISNYCEVRILLISFVFPLVLCEL